MRPVLYLALVVAFAAVPSTAVAGGPVEIRMGEGEGEASVGATWTDLSGAHSPFSDLDRTTGLTFDESAFVDGCCEEDPPSGTATQQSTITDDPEGMTITGSGTATTEGSAENQQVGVGSSLMRSFNVTMPVEYRLSGTTSSRAVVGVSGPVSIGVSGTFSESGVLTPGVYTFSANVAFSSPPEAPRSDSWQVLFEVGTAAPPVAIGSGPSGLTNSRDATFEFTTITNPPPGRFECKLDGGSFTPCTSPLTVNGMADGQHTLQIRYHPDGEDPGAPTERTWTVDATPPSVVFDSAPSGVSNPPDANLVFHSSEPDGAAFRCSLDGGPKIDCSSPHQLFGLASGPHTFGVQTVDRAGNESADVTAAWMVGALPAPAQTIACAAPAETTTGFGVVRLVARAADACFVDEVVDGATAKVTRGTVSLNGITLMPRPGTKIIVSARIGDGTVRSDGPLTVGFGSLILPLERLTLPSLTTAASSLTRTVSFAEGLVQLAGLPAIPAVALELSADNGGQTKATFRLSLPRATFARLPGQNQGVQGVTVEVSPTLSNDLGVSFAGRLKLSEVFLFGEKIKDLDLAYDFGTNVFTGSFGIALAQARPGRPDPTLTGSMTLAPTASTCGIRQVGIQASNLNRHIGEGIFLQRLGGNFQCVAGAGGQITGKLTGLVGASVGPRVQIGGLELEAVTLEGTGTLTLPPGDGPLFEISGAAKVVDIPVASQTLRYKPPSEISYEGVLDLTVAGWGARLEQRNTWINETGFNVEGVGQASFFGLQTSAEGIFSTFGFAVCMGPPDSHVGFGKLWGEPLTSFAVCDVGDFRDTGPARAAGSGGRTFSVGQDGGLTVIEAKGDGAAPKIVVTGPRGERIATPDGAGGLNTREHMLVQDSVAGVTWVALFSPSPGSWTVTTAPGSAAVERMRVADGLPPVRLSAKVTGGKGARRVLSWKGSGLGGQRIQFAERGPDGARPLATRRTARGKLSFVPDPALGRRRTIEATITNRGLPRETITVARYTVAAPKRTRRVTGLRLRRGVLSWKKQAAAKSYEVVVTRPDGTQTTHSTRKTRLRLRALPASGRLRVDILALDVLERPGPVTRTAVAVAAGGT